MQSNSIKIPTQFKITGYVLKKNERLEIKIQQNLFSSIKVIPFHQEMNFKNSLVSEVIDLPIIPSAKNAFQTELISVCIGMDKIEETKNILKSQEIEFRFDLSEIA